MRFVFRSLFLTIGMGFFVLPLAGQSNPTGVPSQAPGDVRPASQEIKESNETLARLAQIKSVQKAAAMRSDYVIGPMDSLDITVFGVPELAKTVQVSNEGQITLPLLGQIQAVGLTAREVELVIAEMLRQKYIKNPQVSVVVKEYKNQPPLLVFGAVRTPGPLQMFSPRSLIEVLAQVGGFTEDVGRWITVRRSSFGQGNPNLMRQGAVQPGKNGDPGDPPTKAADNEASQPQVTKIDVRDLLSYTDPNANMLLYPGDVVDVSKAGIVYVVGDVNRPGGFVLKELTSISILRALALAEGLKKTAKGGKSKIYRPLDDGTAQEIAINLTEVLRGKQSDFQLQPGDMLFVPQSGAKAFFGAAGRNVAQTAMGGAGMMIYR
jgi:polysaccharide export outer membrane protein